LTNAEFTLASKHFPSTLLQNSNKMKLDALCRGGLAAALVMILAGLSAKAQTPSALQPSASTTAQPSLPITPEAVLKSLERVANWQLTHPGTPPTDGWIQAAGQAGMMALAGISGDTKYRDAMQTMAEANGWKPGPHVYDADDHCVGQTYVGLYFLYREPRMITPLKDRFDAILARPSGVRSLEYTNPRSSARENWSWCDSLFMGPPTWLRLCAATGEEKYLDFAVTNWWRTTEFLYDKEEHLFFRDSTFFKKREANGKKVFWSRGNGWVIAGLVRSLQYLPANHPDRPRFEQLFKELSWKILECQQPDGLWHASLLDPASYPLPETSGSGFHTYALAWGVNQGLLERSKFEPAIRKAWTALLGCVAPDGKLTHVQPVGADPKNFAAQSTEPYGVGAFLLAGSEVYRMCVLAQTPQALRMRIRVGNPAQFPRETETVEARLPRGRWAVMDGFSSRILDSQMYNDDGEPGSEAPQTLLFQVDLAPGEARTFYVLDASSLPAVPQPIVKTFARHVPERYDDFAWESDRIAHRNYGQALIKAEGTISSGADVWIKKNRRLTVDTMYRTGHYHQDNGEFMDDYRVGRSRGCGGLGIWDGKKLFVSSNYRNWKLITTGPIRSEFELTFDAWDAGNGRMVSETKRYSIDAGSWFTKAQCTFSSEDKSPLILGVGLAERSSGPTGVLETGRDAGQGWMTYWQPEDVPKGTTATAIVLPKNSVTEFTTDNQDMPESKLHEAVPQPTHEGAPAIRNLLAITKAQVGKPFIYYFGACWDRSGDFTNRVQWDGYVARFAQRRDAPLQITTVANP